MQILMWKIPMVASATNIVTMMTLVWPFPAEIWVLANSSAHYVICWLIFKATAFSVKFKPERAVAYFPVSKHTGQENCNVHVALAELMDLGQDTESCWLRTLGSSTLTSHID